MKAGASLQQKNSNWQTELLERMKQAEKQEAAVGFPRGKDGLGNPHYENGASILQVAIWNNFGTTLGEFNHIPSRPFMKMATKQIQEAISPIMQVVIAKINAGKTDGKKELEILAIQAQGIIQTTITDGGFVPNAPSTIAAKKGSKQPLIDSGDMRKAVTYVIRDKE